MKCEIEKFLNRIQSGIDEDNFMEMLNEETTTADSPIYRQAENFIDDRRTDINDLTEDYVVLQPTDITNDLLLENETTEQDENELILDTDPKIRIVRLTVRRLSTGCKGGSHGPVCDLKPFNCKSKTWPHGAVLYTYAVRNLSVATVRLIITTPCPTSPTDLYMMWKSRQIGSKTLTFEIIEEKKILRIEDMCGNEVYLEIQFIKKMWMLYAQQHWTKVIDLKSAVERLYEKFGALSVDADHEVIYGMEKYYTVEQCEQLRDKYKIGRELCKQFLKLSKRSLVKNQITTHFGYNKQVYQ
ncbi:hypothetical protein FQA39_LY16476 [Lamprigera yunnana]|nr:hypothetical protein FQA39_LY16476 [Lamprigera yunnana]